MSESVTVTNWPSAGTPHAVALELWKALAYLEPADTVEAKLELYAKCLRATRFT